jgi:HD-GYP domain-containing protein (c-di-GMP phosphodiesterase class II)
MDRGYNMINYNRNGLNESDIMSIMEGVLNRYSDTAKCLMDIAKFSDELYRHSTNVALLSVLLGNRKGLERRELENLFLSGLLHDYGKLLIPKNILEKRDILSIEERGIMEYHPAAGFLCLKRDTSFPDDIIYAVLDHHEKMDGSGYSSRKSGINISKYAKFIGITDVYDAMVSDRAYRRAIDHDTVVNFLRMNAGRSLDFDIVGLFMEVLDDIDIKDMETRYFNELKKLGCEMQKWTGFGCWKGTVGGLVSEG